MYIKEALLHQKQRIATTDDSFHSSFSHILQITLEKFSFFTKSSIFALKNLNINHGKKT